MKCNNLAYYLKTAYFRKGKITSELLIPADKF